MLHVALPRRRQHGAGAEEQQALEERMVENVQETGGERQRAAFARALSSRPAILLLDEPFSALDWELRWRLQDELRDWHRAFGCTTLLVSHDLLELFRVADRVMRLDGPPPSLADLDRASQMFAKMRDYLSPFPE